MTGRMGVGEKGEVGNVAERSGTSSTERRRHVYERTGGSNESEARGRRSGAMGHRRSASENLAGGRYLDVESEDFAADEVEMLELGDFCGEDDMQSAVARMFTEHHYSRGEQQGDEAWLESGQNPGPPLEPVGEHEPSHLAGGSEYMAGEDYVSMRAQSRKSNGKGKEPAVELMSMDLKRMKRVMANRMSAARSKERKVKYVHELEAKLQTLRSSIAQSSIQVKILETDIIDLEAENIGLAKRLEVGRAQSQQQQEAIQALVQEAQRLSTEVTRVSHDSMGCSRDGFELGAARPEPVQSE